MSPLSPGRTSSKKSPSIRIAGFTLIELLVAITIFIILTTLTVATFSLNVGSERISAASRQVRAMLDGARSRAFKLQKPVGVRFLLDENFPDEVTSMVYVGAIQNAAGTSYETGRLRFVDLDGTAGSPVTPGIQQLPAPNSLPWNEMNNLGTLQAGVRIRIPAQTGPWYTVSAQNFLNPNNSVMRLVETPTDVPSYGLISDSYDSGRGTVYEYEIDLSSVMAPLEGETPVNLPPNTVIDLTSSKLPSNWYLNRWQASTGYNANDWIAVVTSSGLRAYRSESSGTSDTSAPNWDSAVTVGATINDNGITWRCYLTPQLDVIFTPQGTLFGSVAAEGLLHFTLAETRDTREPIEVGATVQVGIPAWDVSDINGDGESPDHKGSFRIVSVFGASGAVTVSDIDHTDVGGDGVADNIFNYALQGASAK